MEITQNLMTQEAELVAESAISDYATGSVSSVQEYMTENLKWTEEKVNQWFKDHAELIEKVKERISSHVFRLANHLLRHEEKRRCATYALAVNDKDNPDEVYNLISDLAIVINEHTPYNAQVDDKYDDPMPEG